MSLRAYLINKQLARLDLSALYLPAKTQMHVLAWSISASFEMRAEIERWRHNNATLLHKICVWMQHRGTEKGQVDG